MRAFYFIVLLISACFSGRPICAQDWSLKLDSVYLSGEPVYRISANDSVVFFLYNEDSSGVGKVDYQQYFSSLSNYFEEASAKLSDISIVYDTSLTVSTLGDYIYNLKGDSLTHIGRNEGLQDSVINYVEYDRNFLRAASKEELYKQNLHNGYIEHKTTWKDTKIANGIFLYRNANTDQLYMEFYKNPTTYRLLVSNEVNMVNTISYLSTSPYLNTIELLIGTEEGLARHEWTSDPNAPVEYVLRDVNVLALYKLSNTKLLVGTNAGLYVYDLAHNIILETNVNSALEIYDIVTTQNNQFFWLATSQGLMKFENQRKIYLNYKYASYYFDTSISVCTSETIRMLNYDKFDTVTWFLNDTLIEGVTNEISGVLGDIKIVARNEAQNYADTLNITVSELQQVENNTIYIAQDYSYEEKTYAYICPDGKDHVSIYGDKLFYNYDYTYKLYRNNEFIEDIDQRDDSFPYLIINEAGNYKIEIINCNGYSTFTNTVYVYEKDLPEISLSPSGDIELCDGEGAQINVDWGWSYDVLRVTESGLDSYLLNVENKAFSVSKEGVYLIQGYDYSNQCDVFSDTLKVVVNEISFAYIQQVQDSLHAVEFFSNPDSSYYSSIESYQWYRDGKPISGANKAYVIPSQEGTYQVEVFNEVGCSNLSPEFRYSDANDVLGSEASNAFESVQLMPNPGSGKYHLKMPRSWQGDLRVRVLNMQGQLVYQSMLTLTAKADYPLMLSHLKSGLYLVEFIHNNQYFKQKLIHEVNL